MTGFKSGACNMVPGSWAVPFHNRVHGFPYLDFCESGYRFYCIPNADSTLSSPHACSSRQWFTSSLTAFSFYIQEIKWCFTCCVILCVVFQCVFLSHMLFICLIFCLDLYPFFICDHPPNACVSNYLFPLFIFKGLCSPLLISPRNPLSLSASVSTMSSFPDEIYGCVYAAVRVNDVKMQCE